MRRSPLYEAWGEHVKEPAALTSFYTSNGERVDPYTKALVKYDVLMPELPEEKVRLATNLAMDYIFSGA